MQENKLTHQCININRRAVSQKPWVWISAQSRGACMEQFKPTTNAHLYCTTQGRWRCAWIMAHETAPNAQRGPCILDVRWLRVRIYHGAFKVQSQAPECFRGGLGVDVRHREVRRRDPACAPRPVQRLRPTATCYDAAFAAPPAHIAAVLGRLPLVPAAGCRA
jgi:hypothetical protein